MDDASQVIELTYPFEWDNQDEKITEIEIPRPKAKHIRGMNFKKIESGDADEVLKLIQKLTGHPPKLIDRLDIIDIQKIGDVISSFLDSGPAIGQTPS